VRLDAKYIQDFHRCCPDTTLGYTLIVNFSCMAYLTTAILGKCQMSYKVPLVWSGDFGGL
jgi:hypothetical protein